jgi:hypothetical protein
MKRSNISTRWQHLEGATGILFLLLVFSAIAVGSVVSRPADNAPASEFAAALLKSETVLKAAAWLNGLAGLFFLWFVGSLHNLLRRAEDEPTHLPSIAFTVGALWGLLWLLNGQFINAALGFADYYAQPEGAKIAFVLSVMPVSEHGTLLPAALVGATAIAALRTTVFPKWYGQASGILAPLLLLGSGLSVFGLAFPILPLSLMLFFMWVLITSIVLICLARNGSEVGNSG